MLKITVGPLNRSCHGKGLCVSGGGVCAGTRLKVCIHFLTLSHTHTRHSHHVNDLLTVIASLSLRLAVETNHFQTPSAIVSDTNDQLTPCLEGLDAVLNDSPLHFFLLFPAPRLLFSWTHSEFQQEKMSEHFRADSPVQQDFSSQVTCSPARPACRSLSAVFRRERRRWRSELGRNLNPLCGSARFYWAAKCRPKPGAKWTMGSLICPDSRSPPAPQPAHTGCPLGSNAISWPQRELQV